MYFLVVELVNSSSGGNVNIVSPMYFYTLTFKHDFKEVYT